MNPQTRIEKLTRAIRRGGRRIRQIVTFNRRRRKAIKRLREAAAPRFGVDFAWGRPHPAALRAAGVSFVCRYLSHDASKNLSAQEYLSYKRAGIDAVVIWESTAGRATEGKDAGKVDAAAALVQARAAGLPVDAQGHPHRPIYFAVDAEVAPASVIPYFQGVAQVLGVHGSGVYGDFAVVKALFDSQVVGFGWQTYAWSNGAWDRRAQLQQYSNGHTIDGVGVDYDRTTAVDFGQW